MKMTLSLLLLLLPILGLAADGGSGHGDGRRLVVKGIVGEGGHFPAIDPVAELPTAVGTPLKDVEITLRTDHRARARAAVGGPRTLTLSTRSDELGQFELPALVLLPGESTALTVDAEGHLGMRIGDFEDVVKGENVLLSLTLPPNSEGNPFCGIPKPYSASFSRR